MVEISTSILNMKEKEEAECIFALEKAKTDYFHIDVMDGKFVKKDTYQKMLEYSSYIKRISSMHLDVHLMCENVKEAIDDFIALDPSIITIHLESIKDEEELLKTIKYIKQNNVKVGLSIKPETEVSNLYKYLPVVHVALIMTVEPGKGGQTYLNDMTKKIEELKAYIDVNKLEVDIEVDGGINIVTAPIVKKAGANILVAGTSILMANDYKEIIDELKQ